MASKDKAYTLSYSEGSKGWPSFYSYLPEYMKGMNGFFYTWNGGDLYRHNTNPKRNNYYEEQYTSQITSVFNQQPTNIKLFKTMSYESDDRWECTSLFTDLSTGSMLSTYFQQKEGEWFTFLRENAGTVNWRARSANGIGEAVTVTGPTLSVVVTFDVDIDSILSVGDTIYVGTIVQPTVPQPLIPVPPSLIQPPLFSGVVLSVVNQSTTDAAGVVTPSSITIDCTPPLPIIPVNVPTVGEFVFFIKNAVAESHGARGYFLNFTLENTNDKAIELFSVGSSVMQSFP
tara:strand:+ start:1810 stop:2670 length:861 start_codon:yes stop_codon:yes gene_type:complete